MSVPARPIAMIDVNVRDIAACHPVEMSGDLLVERQDKLEDRMGLWVGRTLIDASQQCRSSRSEDVAEGFQVRTAMGRSVCRTWEAQRLFVLRIGQEDICYASWQTQAIRLWSSKVGQEDATGNFEISSLARVAGRPRWTVSPGSSS